MSGIQLPIGIDTVNPVPADYKYGPFATVAAAKAAIPLALRYDGCIVKITGAGLYWWLAADLTDTGLIPFSTIGSSSLPIVRYVYLVQDASDALRMGGTGSNVYTTFQTAYDAANALQVALGGSNIVVIQVGNITAAAAGVLTLVANYNRSVHINGLNVFDSVVGNIVATNAAGNGFTIGTNAGVFAVFTNVSIGNITTNATGATGTSGTVSIRASNIVIGSIDTSITNAANTTGSGGNITFNQNSLINNITLGALTTTSKSTTTNAGTVVMTGVGIFVTSITTAQNNLGGAITLTSSTGKVQVGAIICNTLSASTITFLNAGITTLVLTTANGGTFNFTNILISSTVSISTTVSVATLTLINCIFSGILTTMNLIKIISSVSSLKSIISLGDNSKFANTTVDGSTSPATPTINGIGTGCSFYNCSLLSGSFAIDNPAPVNVLFTSKFSSYENAPNVNVTLT